MSLKTKQNHYSALSLLFNTLQTVSKPVIFLVVQAAFACSLWLHLLEN